MTHFDPPSPPLFRRVTSAFATPAGRGTTASKRRTNVYLSRAKTAPHAPTFPTASSRCASPGWREVVVEGGSDACKSSRAVRQISRFCECGKEEPFP